MKNDGCPNWMKRLQSEEFSVGNFSVQRWRLWADNVISYDRWLNSLTFAARIMWLETRENSFLFKCLNAGLWFVAFRTLHVHANSFYTNDFSQPPLIASLGSFTWKGFCPGRGFFMKSRNKNRNAIPDIISFQSFLSAAFPVISFFGYCFLRRYMRI